MLQKPILFSTYNHFHYSFFRIQKRTILENPSLHLDFQNPYLNLLLNSNKHNDTEHKNCTHLHSTWSVNSWQSSCSCQTERVKGVCVYLSNDVLLKVFKTFGKVLVCSDYNRNNTKTVFNCTQISVFLIILFNHLRGQYSKLNKHMDVAKSLFGSRTHEGYAGKNNYNVSFMGVVLPSTAYIINSVSYTHLDVYKRQY